MASFFQDVLGISPFGRPLTDYVQKGKSYATSSVLGSSGQNFFTPVIENLKQSVGRIGQSLKTISQSPGFQEGGFYAENIKSGKEVLKKTSPILSAFAEGGFSSAKTAIGQKLSEYGKQLEESPTEFTLGFVGGGMENVSKNIFNQIAKEANPKVISSALKKLGGIADDVIPSLSERLSKITKPAEVESVIKKATSAIADNPLLQEARKYKSAEEFANDIVKNGEIKKEIISSRTEPQAVLYYKGTKIIELPDSEVRLMTAKDLAKYGKLKSGAKEALDKSRSDFIKESIFSGETKSQLTDIWNEANKTAQKGVSEVVSTEKIVKPQTTPKNTIQKLIKAIDESIPLRGEQQKLYAQEMAKRTARVAQAGEKIAGEQGFYAQLGQLKDELPKKVFESIRNQFSQEEADLLFDTIEKTKTLLPLEKVSAKGALQKLFKGEVITNNEIQLLQESFPKELVDALKARRPLLEKLFDLGGEILNIPRTAMASTDLSAPLRQGVFMIGRPKQFISAFKDMFKYAFSEKAYQGMIESIKARPTYLKMKQGGLALTEISGELTKREEAFMGNLVEKVPIFGKIVRGSNRAYTGFLNKLRADIFDDILTKAKIKGVDMKGNFLESLADFINAGTGRGKFGLKETGILPKSMEKAAPVMNAAFFSPRLMASRLNLLNPYFYAQLNPTVRKEALKTLFADVGIFGSLYSLWKVNGGEVGLDSRSADFGKIKIGNTRYDVLGGFQQYIRTASQLISGELVSSTTGRTITLGEGYKPLTRKDIALRFFENKTSPIASFIISLLTGQTATGEDVDIPTEIINRFIPMVVQDMYDISQEKGAEGYLYGLPAIFGVGIQTYGKQEYVKGVNPLGEQISQIRPVPELAEKIRELVMGQLPLGTSKTYNVEAYYDQLKSLPKEQAADIFDQIAKDNPELAKKIVDVVKDEQLGITVKDKDLKAKGVASGERALAIKKELDKLKTKEEKAKLWNEYVDKGIITKDVSEQILKLLNK